MRLPVLSERQSILSGRPLRECGACTQCCHTLAVEGLGKPYHVDCRHLGLLGCRIYAERPEECREYECFWLAGMGAPADRPDRSGLLWTVRVEDDRLCVDVHECRPGAIAGQGRAGFQRLVDDAVGMLAPELQARYGGLYLFPFGAEIGCGFPTPDYPDVMGMGMLFHQTESGSGVYVYLGQQDGDGNLLRGGRVIPPSEVGEAFREVVACLEGGAE